MKNRPFFEEQAFSHHVDIDGIRDFIYGMKDTPKELEAFLGDNIDCIATLKGLFDKGRWEGLAVVLTPEVTDTDLTFNLSVRPQKRTLAKWTRLTLTPEGEAWRIQRWEGEPHPGGWTQCNPLIQQSVRVAKADIKVYLGKLKTELRKRN